MKTPNRTPIGAQIVPGRPAELRRLLDGVDADALGALDPSLGEWINRPLGRELLATTILPTAGSTYVCLYSLEPAGLIVVERGSKAGRIRALVVAKDMRRRGVARALLREAIARARERGLAYLWMRVRAANRAAIDGALALEFRRVLPQFLRRVLTAPIPAPPERTRVDVQAASAGALEEWQQVEAGAGDAWVGPLIEADLAQHVLPAPGRAFEMRADGRRLGAANVANLGGRTRLNLWLAPGAWNTPMEIACLRAALDAIGESPRVLELQLGSSGHLKLSAERYKSLGFTPALNEWQLLARPL